MSATFDTVAGDGPLLVSVPHAGTALPEGFAARLSAPARALPDTDWHVDRLYDFAPAQGCGLIVARYSRYVVDLNRAPDDEPLYPGRAGTGLVPLERFDGGPVYRPGAEPSPGEIAERREAFWRPYHAALAEALAERVARFGYALLFDAHSIRSRVPRLFEGRLPDLNLGTAQGESADPALRQRLFSLLAAAPGLSAVLDGRFTGGYITRHYGRPGRGVHAVQLEIAQTAYLMREDPPAAYAEARAAPLKGLLRQLLAAMRDWRPAG